MSGFNNDPRRKQELNGRLYADKIYRLWLGDNIKIDRHEKEDGVSVLDQHFAIDVILTLDNGMLLTGQEKFLSHTYARFGSVTVEYYQNQHTYEQGDWFNLACQFYFCGYLNECQDGFLFAYIMDWPAIVESTNDGIINWKHNRNKNGKQLASFAYTIMSQLPEHCILYHYNPLERNE